MSRHRRNRSIQFRRSLLGVALVAAPLVAAAQENGVFHRVALLTPDQEVPPTNSSAIGAGNFVIDTCANTIRYYITYSCLSSPETAAHIHGASPPGVNSGILHNLPPGNVKTGIINYPEAQENDLLGGRTYVNVHSINFPGGEIRGQIVSAVAAIDPAQEVPPSPVGGVGFGLFNINTQTNTLDYYISVQGLSAPETAAHIHGVARHGANAGVLHALPPGNPKVGVWNYPAALESALLDGLMYVNVHTTAFPGGETRGQISSYVSSLDGRQEVPPNASAASGVGIYSLDRGADELGVDIRHCGLGSPETAAHIHGFAPPGVNAGILTFLPAGPRKLMVWNFGPANEPAVVDGRTYANVHTTGFPGGEIRGQIEFPRLAILCPGDFNTDGVIDINDLTILLSRFGTAGDACSGDMDGNGIIDINDLTSFLSLFGSSC